MNEKVKGLEKSIQTYIDEHPGCTVIISKSKDIQFEIDRATSSWFKWEVFVEHGPSELP